uniref:Uncharacterized protein n=1 Tax=Palpitomonas bilix TaxID=652834 RepID=A0A7S3GAD3_9EUKA|mmetsp:Transcript_32761/g.84616  ORF Transcript_32761/g.84616 Transcript_32761/m.84616 type:complete len:494 (+) Transcript_32761:130-1611(+)
MRAKRGITVVDQDLPVPLPIWTRQKVTNTNFDTEKGGKGKDIVSMACNVDGNLVALAGSSGWLSVFASHEMHVEDRWSLIHTEKWQYPVQQCRFPTLHPSPLVVCAQNLPPSTFHIRMKRGKRVSPAPHLHLGMSQVLRSSAPDGTCCNFSPTDAVLAVGSSDCTISVWRKVTWPGSKEGEGDRWGSTHIADLCFSPLSHHSSYQLVSVVKSGNDEISGIFLPSSSMLVGAQRFGGALLWAQTIPQCRLRAGSGETPTATGEDRERKRKGEEEIGGEMEIEGQTQARGEEGKHEENFVAVTTYVPLFSFYTDSRIQTLASCAKGRNSLIVAVGAGHQKVDVWEIKKVHEKIASLSDELFETGAPPSLPKREMGGMFSQSGRIVETIHLDWPASTCLFLSGGEYMVTSSFQTITVWTNGARQDKRQALGGGGGFSRNRYKKLKAMRLHSEVLCVRYCPATAILHVFCLKRVYYFKLLLPCMKTVDLSVLLCRPK